MASELCHDDLKTEEVKKWLAEVVHFKPILVISGGEPLMRPDIFDIAVWAKQQGLIVSLATNGTLIDEKKAALIKKAGIDRVSVSFDGGTAGVHDTFRQLPGSFESALAGIRFLQQAEVPFQINTTVARHNLAELEDIFQMALDLDAVAIHFFLLVPVGCGVEIAEQERLSPEEYETVLNWIHARAMEKKIHIKPTCAPHYYRILKQTRTFKELMHTGREGAGGRHPGGGAPSKVGAKMSMFTRGCLAGSGVFFISHKGEVFPCGYLPVQAGKVPEQNLARIWENSPVFNRLRDIDQLKGKCGACPYKQVCMGCRARAYFQSGDYMDEEPMCSYELPKKDELSKR